jgi:hypothetical protein
VCILSMSHPEVPHILQTMTLTQHYIDDSSSNEAWKAYSRIDIYLKQCTWNTLYSKYDLLFKNKDKQKKIHF